MVSIKEPFRCRFICERHLDVSGFEIILSQIVTVLCIRYAYLHNVNVYAQFWCCELQQEWNSFLAHFVLLHEAEHFECATSTFENVLLAHF